MDALSTGYPMEIHCFSSQTRHASGPWMSLCVQEIGLKSPGTFCCAEIVFYFTFLVTLILIATSSPKKIFTGALSTLGHCTRDTRF